MNTAPTATCRADGEPLVFTFEYPRYEFICMVCGEKYGFLDPAPAESTPELEARHAELRAQYETERAARLDAAREARAEAKRS